MNARMALVSALLVSAGCGPQLVVPEGAQIRCESTGDCPSGYECVANACRPLNHNDGPRVTVAPLTRVTGALTIPVTLFDAEGDPATVTVWVKPGAGADFAAVAFDSAAALSTTPEGVRHDLLWSTVVADLAALGRPGYVDDAVLRLMASDELGPGPAVETRLVFGNDAPSITDVVVDDSAVVGNAVVRFKVVDSAQDPVDLVSFEVSRLGDFSDAVSVPLSTGPASSFPGGTTVGLRTSPEGVWHNVTWDSRVGADYDAPNVRVRIRVTDALGATSTLTSSGFFSANNAQSAPSLTVTPITDLGATVTTPVQLSVRIDDADGDLCTLFAAYSLDGTTWVQALTADPLVGLQPYSATSTSPHPFTWDIAQLEPASYPQVWLRLSVQDSQMGEPEVVGPFAVDARVAGAVDTSPPNYISPMGDVLARDKVLLRWTSRLGAQSYEVQVAEDANFTSNVLTLSGIEGTEVEVTPTPETSFYWRVRADVTTPGQYSSVGAGQPAQFHLIGSTLYVYCPEGDTTGCSDAGRIGNRSLPFQRLTTAMARAPMVGATAVHIAARGGTAAYDGIVFLQDGVSLRGGYTSSFTTSDPLGNPTRLSGGHSIVYGAVGLVAENVFRPTVVEGLAVQAPSGSDSYGMRVLASTSSLRVRQCAIAAGNGSNLAAGVELRGSAPVFEDVDVASGSGGGETYGILAVQSTVDLTGGTVRAGATIGYATGIASLSGAGLSLTRVAVTTGAAQLAAAVYVRQAPAQPALIDRCQLTPGASATATGGRALFVAGGVLTLRDSTFTAGAAPTSTIAVHLENAQGSITRCTVAASNPDRATALRISEEAPSSPLTAALTVDETTITATGTGGISVAVGVAIDSSVSHAPRISRSTVRASAQAEAVGVEARNGTVGGLSVGVELAFDRVHASALVSDSATAIAVRASNGGGLYRHNALLAEGMVAATALWIEDDGASGFGLADAEGNILGAIVSGGGDSYPTATALRLANNTGNAGAFDDNIVFALNPVSSDSRGVERNAGTATATFAQDLFGDAADHLRVGWQVYDTLCPAGSDTTLGDAGCSMTLYPAVRNCAISTNLAIFATGFVPSDIDTWRIKSDGPADRDNNDVWSTGDAGVDVSETGAP